MKLRKETEAKLIVAMKKVLEDATGPKDEYYMSEEGIVLIGLNRLCEELGIDPKELDE